eukprot:2579721-Prymnesium_polylepis.4
MLLTAHVGKVHLINLVRTNQRTLAVHGAPRTIGLTPRDILVMLCNDQLNVLLTRPSRTEKALVVAQTSQLLCAWCPPRAAARRCEDLAVDDNTAVCKAPGRQGTLDEPFVGETVEQGLPDLPSPF